MQMWADLALRTLTKREKMECKLVQYATEPLLDIKTPSSPTLLWHTLSFNAFGKVSLKILTNFLLRQNIEVTKYERINEFWRSGSESNTQTL